MANTIPKPKQAKKLRLFSFWEEAENVASPWLRRAWQRSLSRSKTRSDHDMFKLELDQTGVRVPGLTLCNCEMSGGNDISLIYPWFHISSDILEINSWLDRENVDELDSVHRSPHLTRQISNEFSQSLSRLGHIGQSDSGKKLVQGTYCIVETLVPSQEIQISGDQLVVLLGFRTTDDNCVDTQEADEERSTEARSWREWTGIGSLYSGLTMLSRVQITRVEFLESHIPDHSAVFHYLVLLYLQTTCELGRMTVLDTVARFRVRQMSGYVTLYCALSPRASSGGSTRSSFRGGQHNHRSTHNTSRETILKKVAEDKEEIEKARKKFLST